MVALASAFVRLRPDPNATEFRKTGKQMGEEAGKGAGEGFDKGYKRDVNGRLRDSRGKFVTDSELMGRQGGAGAGKGFGDSFVKGSSGIAGAIKNNLSLAAGVFVPLGLAAAVGEIGKIGIAYEDNLNIFKAVSEATGDQMDAVAEKARQLGADVQLPGVSAAGAAAAMTELAKAGFSVDQSMAAAKATLQLARVATISEAEAAEIASNAVNAFGLKAEDTGVVVDQLAAAANSSSIEVSEAAFSFKQAAAAFSGLLGPAVGSKEAITELNTAIAILGNNGIKGSDAGTSLKQMLLQLTAPSDQAKGIMIELAAAAGGVNVSLEKQDAILHGGKKVRDEAINSLYKMNPQMEQLGDIAYDASGKLRPLRDIIDLVARGTKDMTQEERNFAITQIFGADATRAVLALLKGGLPVYDQMEKSITQQGAAADFAAAKNAGLGGAIDNVKSQIENAAISIYNVVKGPLTEALNALAAALPGVFDALGKVFGFIRDNFPLLRDLALAIGAVTLALKINAAMLAVTAAGGLLNFVKGVSIVTRITQAWAAAQALLNATLIANPIGAVIIAITALIAGVVLLYRNNEKFRQIVQTVWGAIKTAIGATVDWIKNTAWPAIMTAFRAIGDAAMWLWRNAIKPAWDGIMTVVNVVVGIVRGYIKLLVAEIRLIASVVMWLWRNVFEPVFKVIAKIVEIWWLAVRVVFQAFVNIVRYTVGKAVTWLYENVFKPVFNAILILVRAWWAGVKFQLGLLNQYIIGPMRTALNTLKNLFTAIFNAVRDVVVRWWNNNLKPIFVAVQAGWRVLGNGLSSVYNNTIRPMFQRLIDFLKNNVVAGFQAGVKLIGAAWDKVKEAAKKPISFVVNQVVNPFIRGLNKAAKIVGVKDQVSEISGFASGGQIPGAPSNADNRFARVKKTGRLLSVASGEFITNTRSTLANLPLVKAINAKRGKVTRADVDPYLDGAASGGQVGDGFGDFFSKLGNGFKGIGSAILNPIDTAKKVATSLLSRVPGSGVLVDLAKGAANRIINGAMKWLTDFGIGGAIGGGGVAGGWQGMRNLISGRFPGLKMISGFRPGARTLSGNQSYHALGRAVDYPPVRALAAWIRATFGAKTKELITPYQDLNLHNGKPHRYTGAVWNQHNFAGGNAHVHWAAQHGGLLGPLSGAPIRLFDQGGYWPSGTLGANLSGKTEFVQPAGAGTGATTVEFHAHFHAPVGDKRAAMDLVYGAYQQLRKDGKIR